MACSKSCVAAKRAKRYAGLAVVRVVGSLSVVVVVVMAGAGCTGLCASDAGDVGGYGSGMAAREVAVPAKFGCVCRVYRPSASARSAWASFQAEPRSSAFGWAVGTAVAVVAWRQVVGRQVWWENHRLRTRLASRLGLAVGRLRLMCWSLLHHRRQAFAGAAWPWGLGMHFAQPHLRCCLLVAAGKVYQTGSSLARSHLRQRWSRCQEARRLCGAAGGFGLQFVRLA